MGHTPTPWAFCMDTDYNGELVEQQKDNEGDVILHFKAIDSKLKDNAAFIVRAVNCHADLLAALEALTAHSSGTNHAFFVVGKPKALHAAMAGQKAVLDQARTAIAKAKGTL